MGNCKSVSASLPSMRINSNRKLTLAIVGLDNAGKTVTARCLEGTSVQDVTPTIGFSSVGFSFDNYQVTLYDLGGGAKIRNIWCKYYAEVYGFIFVIDASQESRMEECHSVLKNFLEDYLVCGKPVLVLANKQDIEGAMDQEEIIDALKLEELANEFKSPCRVETCVAIAQNGKKIDKAIHIGFRWLTKVIESDWEKLSRRVARDIELKEEKEKREKEERTKRVQISRELREQEEKRLGRHSQDSEEEDVRGGAEGDPFRPINQQLAISQKREVQNRNNNTSKTAAVELSPDPSIDRRLSSGPPSRTRQPDPPPRTLQPDSPTETEDDDVSNWRGVGNEDDQHSSDGEESWRRRPRSTSHPSPRSTSRKHAADTRDDVHEVNNVEANDRSTAARRYSFNRTEMSPDYSLESRNQLSGRPRDGILPPNSRSNVAALPPMSPLEPIEKGKKKKKIKFKLRRNQTAPSPDLDEHPGNFEAERISRPTSPQDMRERNSSQTRANYALSSDNDSAIGVDADSRGPSLARKWNLVDDLPSDNDESYRIRNTTSRARQPNADYEDDLVT